MRRVLFSILQIFVTLNVAMAADNYDFKVANGFFNYYNHGVDEKLYLQTDREYYYGTGENIWFKGFLINAISHTQINFSNFIYVQLIDKSGKLISQVKVKRDKVSGFSGYIKLDPKMTPGEYSLRAYTKWMTGSDHDLFFEKRIEVVSTVPESSVFAQKQREREAAREAAWAKYASRRERKEAAEEATRDKSNDRLDYNIQFFPEGGALIAGVTQRVAFKALAEDGWSIEVKGQILNSKDEVITEFETTHNGMGMVEISAIEGESYYAKVISSEWLPKVFKLPTPSTDEVALRVTSVGESIHYKVLASNPKQIRNLRPIIHSRGKLIAVDSKNPTGIRSLDRDRIFDGVSVISLVNQNQEVVAERIFFQKPASMPFVDIAPNRSNYESRSKASVDITVFDSKGRVTQGEFAVSVIDDNSTPKDSTLNTAVSYLLLDSEIKGHIEDPGLYFVDDSPLSEDNLDLLMMTQGWRRFDLERVLDTNAKHTRNVQYEDIIKITGEIKGFFGNKARKAELTYISQQTKVFDSFELESKNKFEIMDVDIPDSATYVLQAKGRFGGKALILNVDKETLPAPKAALSPRDKEPAPFSFVNQSMEKFFYDGGLQTIELDDVYITANSDFDAVYSKNPVYSTASEEFEQLGDMLFSDFLISYSGIYIDNDTVTYNGGRKEVLFRVNGMEERFVDISLLTVDLIDKVDFHDSFGVNSGDDSGIVYITLKTGARMPRLRSPNILTYAPLGYQRVEKFYHPQYNTPSRVSNLPPDHRVTIFWSGEVNPDKSGRAKFEFYTADKTTNYRIIVEGVTTQGEICHSEVLVRRGTTE